LLDLRGWWRLYNWLRQETPDLVHAHLAHAAWMTRAMRLLLPKLRIVDTLHSSSVGGPGRRLGYRVSDFLAGRVTAVSEAVAQAHLKEDLVDANKLTVIGNGVDTRQFWPDLAIHELMRQKLELGDGFVFLASGRLEEVKNYPLMLNALARLKEPATLVIAGEGSERPRLEAMVQALRLGRRVRFVGFTHELRNLLQTADGFLLSSHWEGLPMGVLEASACSLPSIVTDVPGTEEVVRHGVTGWRVMADNPDTLAAAMAALVRLPAATRRTMGQRARQSMMERYSLEAMLDRWETLYGSIMAARPIPFPQYPLERQRKPPQPAYRPISNQKTG